MLSRWSHIKDNALGNLRLQGLAILLQGGFGIRPFLAIKYDVFYQCPYLNGQHFELFALILKKYLFSNCSLCFRLRVGPYRSHRLQPRFSNSFHRWKQTKAVFFSKKQAGYWDVLIVTAV